MRLLGAWAVESYDRTMQVRKRRHIASSPTRVPLRRPEILDLDGALEEAFRLLRDLRRTHPAAEYIKFPAIPAILSESITAHLSPRLLGGTARAVYGGRVCDLIVDDGTTKLRVEVKATGEGGFQEIKSKDLEADYLVWMDFGTRYSEGRTLIRIYVVSDPGTTLGQPGRIMLGNFLNRATNAGTLVHHLYDLWKDELTAWPDIAGDK